MFGRNDLTCPISIYVQGIEERYSHMCSGALAVFLILLQKYNLNKAAVMKIWLPRYSYEPPPAVSMRVSV